MLMPARTKFRKLQKGRVKGEESRGNYVAFGDFGLQALKGCLMTTRQIEAGRVALIRSIKKGAKLWIRVFPDKPITKKPAETRMGKGKGNVEDWAAVVKRGRIIYEIQGVNEEQAKEAFRLAGRKLPIPTRMVKREVEI